MRGRFRFWLRPIVGRGVLRCSPACPRRLLAAGLPRVASMNVCTDQLLLPLADPAQIVGLSRFSRDAWQSFAAGDARRYPALSGGAEDILVLQARCRRREPVRQALDAGAVESAGASSRRIFGAAQSRRGEGSDPADGRNRRASRSRGGGNRPARCRDGAGAPGRHRQAFFRAAAGAARLGLGARQSGLFAAVRGRPVQRGRRAWCHLRRLRLAGGDRQCQARFSSGIGSRRSRRG